MVIYIQVYGEGYRSINVFTKNIAETAAEQREQHKTALHRELTEDYYFPG